MASLYDLKVGQETEWRRVLSEAGFTVEDIVRVIREPRLAERMFAAASGKQPKVSPLIVSLNPFVEPVRQMRNVFEWSKAHRWGFSDKEIRESLDKAPDVSSHEGIAVLVPYLDDACTTFAALWSAARRQQKNFWECEVFKNVTSDTFRLAKGVVHPRKSLRWEVIDFGANCNRKVVDVRDPKTAPHAGILAAAAHFPSWAQALQGEPTPEVIISGYECDLRHLHKQYDRPALSAPVLEFRTDECLLALCAGEIDYSYETRAIPVIRRIVE